VGGSYITVKIRLHWIVQDVTNNIIRKMDYKAATPSCHTNFRRWHPSRECQDYGQKNEWKIIVRNSTHSDH